MVAIETDELETALEGVAKDAALEAANRWFSAANERLMQAGDELDYDTFSVAQAARPPRWDNQQGAYIIAWPHVAAQYFEYGTAPHEVTGSPLAFDWPEMEGEEFGDTGKTFDEVFEDTWPTVFLQRAEVDGVERIGYRLHGEREARRWLSQQGD